MLKLNLSALMKAGFTRPDVDALQTILNRSGIGDNAITTLDNQKQFEEEPLTSPEAMKALRLAEELHGELQYIRSDLQSLRAQIEEMQNNQSDRPNLDQLRNRIADIEDRLA